ncbi:Type IV fimbrial biogenesis protein FimT [Marinobacterium lacunae]|uniref:Type II secretion system protein H n=1 Tax=Marinobacterium lacunae TaxID=1232683 RepID=A0A081G1D2_9GAMM|nr:GspH/FimT family pseudopilin [Marinobacterium lacunae]KEA64587.1 Type IV fimbrial biogenesis protein FimT [Marinobacterium lacunae]
MPSSIPVAGTAYRSHLSAFGFTLLELMVALAILAILLAVGVPSFQSFIQRSQLDASREGLESALYLSRSEAVTRATRIVLCRRNGSGSACADANNWNNGWLVAVSGGEVLRTWDAPQGSVSLTIAQAGGGGSTSITFEADGSVSGDSAYSFSLSGPGNACSLSVSQIGTFSSVNC